jgi:hypothetical protein
MKASQIIQKHIAAIPRGKLFKASKLSQAASNGNVRLVLSRLVKAGKLLHVTRGVYVRPIENPYVGKVMPNVNEIIKVIVQNSGEQITSSGAGAANILGLSTQVPMQSIYLTSGRTRHIKIGEREVILKHAQPRKLLHSNTPRNLVINALWYLGKASVNKNTIEQIRQKLKKEDYEALLRDTHQMPAWMANAFLQYQKTMSNHG